MLAPALRFSGSCKEAFDLYERAFGGEGKAFSFYRDEPGRASALPDGFGDKVMHATLYIGGSRINACDIQEPVAHGNDLCLNVALPTDEAVKTACDTLVAAGGVADIPAAPTFFASMYGRVKDPYGYTWQIMHEL